MRFRLRSAVFAVTYAIVAASLPLQASGAEPTWIFGCHDPGGYTKIEQAGKRGWLVITKEIGHNPTDYSGDDFTFYSSRGHGVIVRLNNGYGTNGTLPLQSEYQNFATRCANYVAATTGADIFIIGNETNLPREWPVNPSSGEAEPITVARYVDCYNRCYTAIKNARPDAQVCPSPAGTWAPPYPEYGIEGFLDYWVNILNGVGASKVDCLILHAYTHGCDPALVRSEAKMGPPYQDIYYNFRVYRNYLNAVPAELRDRPVYITECDQNIECADPPPTPRHTWYNVNNDWVEEIYSEINDWNLGVSNQKIRCVALFRWDDVAEGEWSFGFSNRSNVVADWLEAMQNDYRWDAALRGTVMGYVRDSSSQPIKGALVTLSPGSYSSVSGVDGRYTISEVEPGTYSVTASKNGYSSQTHSGITVSAAQTSVANFTLQSAPVAVIETVQSAATIVDRGDEGIEVAVTVRNAGSQDLQVDTAYPTFWQNSTDVSSYYTVAPNPSNGRLIPRGGSLTLNFQVDVHPDAPLGATTINGYVKTWPNVIANGSFEEGGAVIPPVEWTNWTNLPGYGASWAYDTATKYLGARSYKLSLDNSINGVYATCNTGDAPDLMLVEPSTQYYNSIKKRSEILSGSTLMMLIFQEYDANMEQIGYDQWHYFYPSADWEEVGVNRTTSSNAAYARVWTGFRSTATTTSAALWIDDVQLRPLGVYYSDSTAQTTDSWIVQESAAALSISEIKAYEDGSTVAVADKIITARFDTSFYIEEDNRHSGIRVDGTTTAQVGDRVDVLGFIVTSGVERSIVAQSVTYKSPAVPPAPLGLTNLHLGGSALNEYTPGVWGGVGMNNLGLLVNIWGAVTYADSACFYVDDGSGLTDASGHTGVRVSIASPTPGETVVPPPVGSYVSVVGISTTYDSGPNSYRCVRVRSQSDIRTQ